MVMDPKAASEAPTAPVQPKPMKECPWTLDDAEGAIWTSSCGQTWQFVDGGPRENRARFCHYCGGRIVTNRKDRRAAVTDSPASSEAEQTHQGSHESRSPDGDGQVADVATMSTALAPAARRLRASGEPRAEDVCASSAGSEPADSHTFSKAEAEQTPPPDDMRIIHSSEIADDPAAFAGDYVPLEDVASWQRRAQTAPQWQPIETAPKEGYFLVFDDYGVDVATGEGVQHGDFHPTHWMPLPAPPLPAASLHEE